MTTKREYTYFGTGAIETADGRVAGFGKNHFLSDEVALAIMERAGGIVPRDRFAEIGFTDDERKSRAYRAGPEFVERTHRALKIMREFRDDLLESRPQAETLGS